MGQSPPTAAQDTQLALTHGAVGALKEQLENSMRVQELASWKAHRESGDSVCAPGWDIPKSL